MSDARLGWLVDDLRADLRSAIALRDQSLSRRFDQDFVDHGGKIIYAVDASVVNQIFQPPRSDRKKSEAAGVDAGTSHYQIFLGPREPHEIRAKLKDQQARLARVIPGFLVEGRIDGDDVASNLLLLPGHATEVRNLYDAIVEELQKEPRRVAKLELQVQRLRAVVEGGRDFDTSEDDEQTSAIEALSRNLFDIDEPHLRFRRMNEILRKKRIVGLRAAAPLLAFRDIFGEAPAAHVARAAAENSLPSGEPEEEGSSSWWESKLTGRLPANFLPSDRAALATLDRLNRALDPEKTRIVLFTSNRPIIDAGSTYKPFKDSGSPLSPLSFADLYLRHPSCLIVDSAFVMPHGVDDLAGRPPDPNGWIDTLLAATLELQTAGWEWEGDGAPPFAERWLAYRRLMPELNQKADQDSRLSVALRKNRALHFRFVVKWASHVAALTNDHILNAESSEKTLADLLNLKQAHDLNAVDHFIDQARSHVRTQSERSWSDFFNTAADTGLELIGLHPIGSAPSVWPTPPLYIRGNDGLLARLAEYWMPSVVRGDPDGMLRRLKTSDDGEEGGTGYVDIRKPAQPQSLQSSYVHALCYGLLFAYAGRWALTRLLAQRAIQIARGLMAGADEPSPGDGVFVTGREAYYLLAVCGRVTARTSEDYADARDALLKARNSPRDPAESPDVDEPMSGLRLETEEVAVDVGEAISRGVESPEEAHRLRARITATLNRSSACRVVRIRMQQCIALRSEYFLTLALVSKPHSNKSARLSEIRQELIIHISKQLADLSQFYDSLDTIPLRDRTLLRLAAVTAGVLADLPATLQGSSVELLVGDHANAASPLDKRRLMRLERLIN